MKKIIILVMLILLSSFAYALSKDNSQVIVYLGSTNSTHWIDNKTNSLPKFPFLWANGALPSNNAMSPFGTGTAVFNGIDASAYNNLIPTYLNGTQTAQGITFVWNFKGIIGEDDVFWDYSGSGRNVGFRTAGRTALGNTIFFFMYKEGGGYLLDDEGEGTHYTDYDTNCFAYVVNSTHGNFFVNGTLQKATALTSSGNTKLTSQEMRIADSSSLSSVNIFGNFSDFLIYNGTLPLANITDYCRNGLTTSTSAPVVDPFTEAPTIRDPSPADNYHTNTNVTLNVSHTTINNDVRYYLYFDTATNPIKQYLYNVTRTAQEYRAFITNVSDGTYYYKWQAQNKTSGLFSANTTTRKIVFDTTAPFIIINPNNGFNEQNTTIISSFLTNLSLNITFTDDNLYDVLINITNTTGKSVYSYYNSSLGSNSSFTFLQLVNLNSLAMGRYNVALTSSDQHTKTSIKDFATSKPNKETLHFLTDCGINLDIQSLDSKLDKLSTAKKIDRYNFELNFTETKGQLNFILTSDSKITYLPSSPYSGHFIVKNGACGNWIDFNEKDLNKKDYAVTKINDYSYSVLINNVNKNSFNFESVGGLNVNTKSYTFEIGAVIDVYINDDYSKTYLNATVKLNGTIQNTFSNGTVTTPARFVNVSISSNNITANSSGYIQNNFNLTAINSPFINLTFGLMSSNSALFYIYDETSNSRLYTNISLLFAGQDFEQTAYTNTSVYYISNLMPSEYSVFFTVVDGSLGYGSRNYYLNLGNGSFSIINVYLAKNTSQTTFTISDKDTSLVLGDVLTSMYRYINGSWTATESKLTDITGKAVFNYIPNIQYKFLLTKTSYTPYVFYLNPVLYSSYDILLTKSTDLNSSQDYDRIGVTYAPVVFTQGFNSFGFLIQSPFNELINYGYTLTYPGGSTTASGTTAAGGQLNNNFSISGATAFDRLRLDYYYRTNLAGTRNFTYYYAINLNSTSTGNYTMISNKTKTYGLGIFERLLIATIIVLLVVGIATLIGQPIPGFMLGLMIYGYLFYIGFIPLWSILITLFLGVVIMASRSDL